MIDSKQKVIDSYYKKYDLSPKSSIDDIKLAFLDAMEKYFKNSITLSELSHISNALYSDFVINTNYLKTDTGDVIAEVADLNFYLDSLDIYKDSKKETAKETYDHSKRYINRTLEYLKQYASQQAQNTGK